MIERVLVCGCSGSGKSTLARRLAERLGLPYISLDAHYWLPGWKPGGDALLRERAAPLIAGEHWVVDGNYFNALGDLHLARATHVVFFDLPRWFCLISVLGRVLASHGRTRPEMAPGCPERFDWALLRYIWHYRTRQRPRLMARFALMRPEQVLLRFTRRADAESWLAAIPMREAA